MNISKEGKLALKFYTLATLCIILLTLTTGCAAFNKLVTNNELVTQLATEAATARVLHEHPFWKPQVISITEDAIAFIDNSKLVVLGDVETYVKGKIAWTKMMPEEQALVSTLISAVVKNLEDSFRAQNITETGTQLVQVKKVLGWMNATAKRQ